MPNVLKKQLIWILLVCFHLANAQSPLNLPEIIPVYSETVISEDFPSLCTNDIFQDKKGRLWLTTCNYMARINKVFLVQYDGYDYRLVEEGLEVLKEADFVNFFELTHEGQLLGIADFNNQRRFFSYDTESFTLEFIEPEEIGIMAGKIIGMQVKENGTSSYVVQNGNQFELYEGLDSDFQLKASFSIDTNLLTAPFNTPLRDFKEVHFFPLIQTDQEIWLAANNRSYIQWEKKDNRVNIFNNKEDFPFPPDIPRYPHFNAFGGLNKSVIQKDGKIYFSSIAHQQNNLFAFKKGKNQMENLPLIPQNWINKGLFSDKVGNAIFLFHYDRKNFAILEDKNGKWYDYSKMIELGKGVGIRDIISTDFRKEIIINSTRKLIFRTVNQEESIRNYYPEDNIVQILPYQKNRKLVRTRKNRQWTILNEQTDSILPLPKQLGAIVNFDNKPLVIFMDDENHYWINSRDKITQYNPSTDSSQYFTVDLEDYKVLFAHQNKAILIQFNCVYFYDVESGERKPIIYNGKPFCFPLNPKKGYLFLDGYLWILSINGIWKINWNSGLVEHFVIHEASKKYQYGAIQIDKMGRFWLGTYHHGVHLYDPKSKEYKVIDQQAGLCNNTVASILEDEDGAIWIGTYKGISVLSQDGAILANLFEKDGLSHNEMNREAFLKSADNQLYFGTIRGLNVINPKTFRTNFFNQTKPKIYLTALSYFNEPIQKDTLQISNFTSIQPIKLPAAQRYLKLSFALDSYTSSGENQFAYMLDGIDKDWKIIQRQHEINFNSLPAGNYKLLIKGKNANGVWTSNQITIPIRAQEFFYKQYWFYILCALPLGLLAFLWIKRLNIERARLATEVAKATEKIRKDKELIEAQAMELQSLDKAKSRFFTNISHEFRTPLTIISGMIDQVKKNPELWMDKGTKMIKQNAQNLLQLVNQILDLRKLESDSLQLNLVNGDIISYLRYIHDSYQIYAQTEGLQIHFLSSNPELVMDYDPDKLLQIFSNLLSNSIKHTPKGGHIYIQTDSKVVNQKSIIEIRIKDTGKGIPEEQLPYIFDRFYQVNQLDKEKKVGSGIGLALTQELIKLMNGDIKVTSQLNKGTTFIIQLPITQTAELSISDVPKPALEVTPIPEKSELELESPLISLKNATTENPSLLIVEDNEDVVQYLIACLQESYQLEIAHNGQEGIDKAIESIPDLIVSDVMMPKKDGFELCQTLKMDERTSHIPIVLLTAKAGVESKIEGLTRGADAYMTKPIESEELLIRLKNLLKTRQQLQERLSALQLNTETKNQEPSPEDIFLSKIIDLVEKNISDDGFGNAQLAQKMRLSESQLYRKIKALTNKSTAIFIRSIRLKKGKKLLQSTDLTVSEVAYEVGFTNLEHFSRSFSKEFGNAPSAIRK